jgi:hypothetical protein
LDVIDPTKAWSASSAQAGIKLFRKRKWRGKLEMAGVRIPAAQNGAEKGKL